MIILFIKAFHDNWRLINAFLTLVFQKNDILITFFTFINNDQRFFHP